MGCADSLPYKNVTGELFGRLKIEIIAQPDHVVAGNLRRCQKVDEFPRQDVTEFRIRTFARSRAISAAASAAPT